MEAWCKKNVVACSTTVEGKVVGSATSDKSKQSFSSVVGVVGGGRIGWCVLRNRNVAKSSWKVPLQ